MLAPAKGLRALRRVCCVKRVSSGSRRRRRSGRDKRARARFQKGRDRCAVSGCPGSPAGGYAPPAPQAANGRCGASGRTSRSGSHRPRAPFGGTRPRGKTEQEDRALADELLADEKEKAEHVMLVDLGRNDISRVAQSGSVQVIENMVIQRYSKVMHIVYNEEGVVRSDGEAYEVIKVTF